MPGNVDERIVEMRIDNKQFESGAKTTINTLGKLDKAMHLTSDSKALDNLASKVSSFDASPMTSALEKVSSAFGSMEAAGMRVIQNLTDSIMNFATKTVRELTLGQVSEGWDKYADKTEAVQSIMAATRDQFESEAEQMEFINEQLDRMMWYTDETSYNFVDMAHNVGKFLAAGVGLGEGETIEDAFTAMMGIASWGASAGAKPAEVSRAMYNISQALSTGKMAQIDWKSIENAGMATLAFKQNVIDIAVDMGKLSTWTDTATSSLRKYYKAGIDMSQEAEDTDIMFDAKSFREQLKSGWFDNELMAEVFKRYGEFTEVLYAGVQDTGMEASELMQILDRYKSAVQSTSDEAIDWTANAREARKLGKEVEVIQDAFDWSKYVGNDKEAIEQLQQAIKGLINTQWDYSEQGFRMGQEAKTWEDTLEATKDAVSSKWMRTFQWVIGDFLEAKEFWTEITARLYEVFAAGGDVRNAILEAWHNHGGRDALFNLDEDSGPIGGFWKLLDAIESVLGPIKEAYYVIFGMDTQKAIQETGRRLAVVSRRFQIFAGKLQLSEQAQEGLSNIFGALFSGIKSVMSLFSSGAGIFGKFILAIKEIADAVLSLFADGGIENIDAVLDRISGALKSLVPNASTIQGIIERIHNRGASLREWLSGLKDDMTIIGNAVKARLIPVLEDLVARYPVVGKVINVLYDAFHKISGMITELAQKIPSLSSMPGLFSELLNNITTRIPSLSVVGENLSDIWDKLKAIFQDGFDLSRLQAMFREGLSILGNIVSAIFGDPADLKAKLKTAVNNLLTLLKEALNSVTFHDIFKAFTNALKISFVVELFSVLENVRKTLKSFREVPGSINDMFGGVTETFNELQKSLRMNTLLKVAISIGILTASLVALSKVPTEKLVPAVAAIGVLLLLMAKITKNIDNFSLFSKNNVFERGLTLKVLPTLAANVLAIAIALGVLFHAILQFKKNDVGWGDIDKVLVVLVATLGMIAGFMAFMKNIKANDVGKSFGLLVTVFAIIGRVGKIAVKLQDIPWLKLLIIFGGISLVLLAVGAMLTKMSVLEKFDGSRIIQTAGMIVGIGLAVMLIGNTIKKLGNMNFGHMLQGILGIALVLGGLYIMMSRITAMRMNPAGIIKIAGALILIALAVDILTPVMSVFGTIMSTVIGIIPWNKLSKGLSSFGQVVLKLIGLAVGLGIMAAAMYGFGAALLKFGLGAMATAGAFALVAIGIYAIAQAMSVLGDSLPRFLEGLFNTIEVIKQNGDKVVDLIGVILMAVAGAILARKLDISLAVAELIITAVYVIGKKGPEIAQAFITVFNELQQVLQDFFDPLAMFLIQAMTDLFNAVADAIEANEESLAGSITRVIKSVISLIATTIKTVLGEEGFGSMGFLEQALFMILVALTGIKLISKGMSIAEPFTKLKETIEGGAGAGGAGGLLGALSGVATWLGIIAAAAVYANHELNAQQDILRDTAFEGLESSVEGYEAAIDRTKSRIAELKEQSESGWGTYMSDQELDAQTRLLGQLEEEYEAMKTQALEAGKEVPKNTAAGIAEESGAPVEASQTVAENVVSVFDNMSAGSEASGWSYLSGWNNGFVDFWNSGVIQSNIENTIGSIIGSTYEGLDEHSPSRIAEQAGAYYIIGLAQGISGSSDLPMEAIRETTDPMVTAVENAMMQVAAVADDGFVISPTIAPVVDLSNVNSAASSMNSMFGTANIGATFSPVSMSQAKRYSDISFNTNSADVVDRMQDISAQLDILGDRIANMQIVLDSGELVGATSSRIDNSLGRIAVRRTRAN